jgi:hypothetical protein
MKQTHYSFPFSSISILRLLVGFDFVGRIDLLVAAMPPRRSTRRNSGHGGDNVSTRRSSRLKTPSSRSSNYTSSSSSDNDNDSNDNDNDDKTTSRSRTQATNAATKARYNCTRPFHQLYYTQLRVNVLLD